MWQMMILLLFLQKQNLYADIHNIKSTRHKKIANYLQMKSQSGVVQTENGANGFRQQTEQKRSKLCEGGAFLE
jgi:hypothetical protein